MFSSVATDFGSWTIYLKYKYYITMTKTGGRYPVPRPSIHSAKGRGDVVMRMETQQQLRQVCK